MYELAITLTFFVVIKILFYTFGKKSQTKNMNVSTATTKYVCYKRNRDYKKQFNWTYELNKDFLIVILKPEKIQAKAT